jgi:hypothetical protein
MRTRNPSRWQLKERSDVLKRLTTTLSSPVMSKKEEDFTLHSGSPPRLSASAGLGYPKDRYHVPLASRDELTVLYYRDE